MSSSPASPHADRTTLHMHRERGVHDLAEQFLRDGIVAHVGIADAEGPVVIPMTYHFDPATPDELYLHGAHNSRLMRAVAAGGSVCVTVTMADGLVYSKTALNHSVNYRCVVCFCHAAATQPDAERKRFLLDGLIGRYWPGRGPGNGYAPMSDAHLDATAFVALTIDAMSAKQRTGGSKGPGDDDPTVPGTAGVTELRPGL
jgi:nitroimidazol reductase NimA-like FMN-containing flavoprotein (pyridoxamine 5'-phosphate oxidase superfamily)